MPGPLSCARQFSSYPLWVLSPLRLQYPLYGLEAMGTIPTVDNVPTMGPKMK
jgi:hypothetical protein